MDTDSSTPTEMVPADETVNPRRQRSRAAVVLTIVAILGVVAFIAASTIKISYFTQSPGSAVPLQELISIDGAAEFESDGEFYFTTVRLTGEITIIEYLLALADSAVVLRTTDEVLGTETRDEQRARNLELMADSQEISIRVALERLGFDVIVERGALITSILQGSGSDGVLEPGDVVIVADGRPVTAGPDLVDVIQSLRPGDELTLTVERLGTVGEPANRELVVILGESEGRPQLGVGVTTALDLVDLPFEVDIATASVGGPSAGLALALATLDLLSEGELTGGMRVATTGTIDVFGNVGPIGGAEQKAHAVRRAGISLFLVPVENFEEASRGAGDDVEVVAVATLDEALQELASRGGERLDADLIASAG